jgi:hypothetical protein
VVLIGVGSALFEDVSIGAQRVKNVCVTFRTCCDKEDKKG